MRLIILAAWLCHIGLQQDLLDVSPSETIKFRIPQNAEEGDEVFADRHIRINKNCDETINLQLEGANPAAVAINGSLLDAGQLVQFILVNKNALQNENSKFKLQAIGVITGKMEEVSLEFNSDYNSDLPMIESIIPTFVIQNDFQETESTIIKTTSPIPQNIDIELVGRYSDHFRTYSHNNSVFIETVPCKSTDLCDIKYPFSLILQFRNSDNHMEYMINFDQDQKNSLKMVKNIYETEIEEHTGIQEKLIKIEANGNFSELIYSLRDSSGIFGIHPKEGILSVLHPEFLTISSFGKSVNLTAIATDGQNSVSSIVVVHILPKLEKSVEFGFEKDIYEIDSEISIVDSKIGNIAAKPGNLLTYRIIEGRFDLYEIRQNGDIEYVGNVLKDDRKDRLVVAVQETNGGLRTSSAEVRINLKGIGSNPIRSRNNSSYVDIISDDDQPGVVVSSFEFEDQDPDAKMKFEMRIVEGADRNGILQDNLDANIFELKSDPENYQAYVIIGKGFQSSNLTNIKIEIVASDVTHPKEPPMIVTKRILVETLDNNRKFQNHFNIVQLPEFIILPEDSPIGTFVYKPVITSQNNVSFSIEPSDLFDILVDGTILINNSLKNQGNVDKIPIKITVKSEEDEMRIGETTVKLVKKMVKHFMESEYSATLPRGAPSGTVVALVAAIDTNGETIRDNFALRGINSEMFDVDSQGTIKTNEKLLETNLKDISFMAVLRDDPSVSAPVFLKLENLENDSIRIVENELFATVYDNLPINSFVSKIKVIEEKLVKFSLSSNESRISDLFHIDDDGTIRNSEFLIGFNGMHKLTILISSVGPSGVRSNQAVLIVDILKSNECSPKLKPEENLIFHVRENMPSDTIIGKVSAEDIDEKCQLRFALWESSKNASVLETDILKIDEKSGELRTVKGFDYEKKKSFIVVLELSTIGNLKTRSTAELRIMDQDDHKIRFDQSIQKILVAEDISPSTVIATVRAEEGDNQKVFYHLSRTSPPQFSLHSTTGKVILEQPLDRELQDEYIIEIGASNNPKSEKSEWETSMKLIVKVKDVNDNVPQFEVPDYDVVVDKNVVVGTNLLQIHASDPDSDDRDKTLEYSITQTSFEYRGMSRNVDGMFDVKLIDGDVFNLRSLKDYVGGVFHVSLQVRDPIDGTIGMGRLKVYVHDQSDLLVIELPYKPLEVTPQIVQEFKSQLTNLTNLLMLPKKIVYRSAHGITSQNSVDLQLAFFNKTSSEIIPAEKVIAVCENLHLHGLPKIRRFASEITASPQRSLESWIDPQLLIIGVAFVVIFLILMVLCALLMCYYRNKYQREMQSAHNDAVIKDALNVPVTRSPALLSFKHYPSPAIPEMSRPIPNGDNHVYKSKRIDNDLASYAVQQATIIVPEK